MEGVAHDEEIQEFKYNDMNLDVDESMEEEEKDTVKKVLKYTASEANTDVAIIGDANQPALERVTTPTHTLYPPGEGHSPGKTDEN